MYFVTSPLSFGLRQAEFVVIIAVIIIMLIWIVVRKWQGKRPQIL